MENTNYNKDQVFISFRGKDERYKFLTHLKQKLIDGNVNVFTDDNGTGKPLKNLFKQIRKSRIAIVIFSKNYAESQWCLDEMVEIKKCIETEKLKAAIPIFYKVKVCSVKKQSGKFGRKFKVLQDSLLGEAVDKKTRKHVNSRIKRWKKAFKVVTGMIGLSYNKNSSELDFVNKVVEKVNINLAQIAAEEGRNVTQETTKISQGKAANLIMFNVNQLNLTYLLHSSKTLEALSLAGSNLEGYIRSDYLKPLSPNLSPYIEEPYENKILEPKVPQTGPRPGHKRTVSYHNDRDQYYPLPFMVPKKDVDQCSSDSIDLKKYNNGGTSCVSSLRYVFELCLSYKDDPEVLRK